MNAYFESSSPLLFHNVASSYDDSSMVNLLYLSKEEYINTGMSYTN
jgi:hypothetical protein